MDPETRSRVAGVVGQPVVDAHRVVGGGYTPAERWIVRFADDSSAFVKIGTSELTSGWLRQEAHRYAALDGDFLPAIHGSDDQADRPLLVLEDLSAGRWPPPWSRADVDRVVATVRRMASTRPLPGDLPALESLRPGVSSWAMVRDDPRSFLGLGLCGPSWLEAALPALIDAQDAARLGGDDLIHFDLRSDNMCLLNDRVVLVDWNGPAIGRGAFDLAFWAPSLRLEGGPLPEELVGAEPELAAIVSGFFAARAGLPDIPDAPRVRWIQRRQLRIALPWAARALGLPAPDQPWARPLLAQHDEDLAAARIDEAEWSRRVEEDLIDAYLASDDPRAQSGKGGDEAEWRWSRELALDAAPGPRCDVLDVGCANGYLMESFERWGAGRGMEVTAYGLEISDRMASAARFRAPHHDDRIFVGDALTWTPPRRFGLVHTALDYAVPSRRRPLVERALREFAGPGGRVVFRAERVRAGSDDIPMQLRAIGFEPDGIIEAVHPVSGEIRRTAWLQAR